MADLNTTIHPHGPFGVQLQDFLTEHSRRVHLQEHLGESYTLDDMRVARSLNNRLSSGQPFTPNQEQADFLARVVNQSGADIYFPHPQQVLERLRALQESQGWQVEAPAGRLRSFGGSGAAVGTETPTIDLDPALRASFRGLVRDLGWPFLREGHRSYLRAAGPGQASAQRRHLSDVVFSVLVAVVRHNPERYSSWKDRTLDRDLGPDGPRSGYRFEGLPHELSLSSLGNLLRWNNDREIIPNNENDWAGYVWYLIFKSEHEQSSRASLIDLSIQESRGDLVYGVPLTYPSRNPQLMARVDSWLEKTSLEEMDGILQETLVKAGVAGAPHDSNRSVDSLLRENSEIFHVSVPGERYTSGRTKVEAVCRLFNRWAMLHRDPSGPTPSRQSWAIPIGNYIERKRAYFLGAPEVAPVTVLEEPAPEPLIYQIDWRRLSLLRLVDALRPTSRVVGFESGEDDSSDALTAELTFQGATPHFSFRRLRSDDTVQSLFLYRLPSATNVPFLRGVLSPSGTVEEVDRDTAWQVRVMEIGGAFVYPSDFTEDQADAHYLGRLQATANDDYYRYSGGVIESEGGLELLRNYAVAYYFRLAESASTSGNLDPEILGISLGDVAFGLKVDWNDSLVQFRQDAEARTFFRLWTAQSFGTVGHLGPVETVPAADGHLSFQRVGLPDIANTQIVLRSDGRVRLVPGTYTNEQIRSEMALALSGTDSIEVQELTWRQGNSYLFERYQNQQALDLGVTASRRRARVPLPYRPIYPVRSGDIDQVLQSNWKSGAASLGEIETSDPFDRQRVTVPFTMDRVRLSASFDVLFDGYGAAAIDIPTFTMSDGGPEGARFEVHGQGNLIITYQKDGWVYERYLLLVHDGNAVQDVIYNPRPKRRKIQSRRGRAVVEQPLLTTDPERGLVLSHSIDPEVPLDHVEESAGYDRYRNVPIQPSHLLAAVVQSMPVDFSLFVYGLVENDPPLRVRDWEQLLSERYPAPHYHQGQTLFLHRAWRHLDPAQYVLFLLADAADRAGVTDAEPGLTARPVTMTRYAHLRTHTYLRAYRGQGRLADVVDHRTIGRELRVRAAVETRRRYIESLRRVRR